MAQVGSKVILSWWSMCLHLSVLWRCPQCQVDCVQVQLGDSKPNRMLWVPHWDFLHMGPFQLLAVQALLVSAADLISVNQWGRVSGK